MGFVRPDLSTLIDRAQADLNSRIPGADSRIRRRILRAVAVMHGGAMNSLYGALQSVSADILPDSSSDDVLPGQAAIYGVYRKPAVAAQLPATLPGTNGETVPAGTVFTASDGTEFTTPADVEITDGSAALTVVCSTPGSVGALDVGVQLSISSPIDGVGTVATVSGVAIVAGVDQETIPALRSRLLARLAQQPQGGAQNDYEEWTLAFPEVTRVWVYPGWMGAGTVGVTFTMDNRDDIIPTGDDVAAVAAYLNTLRPVTAQVVVFAPTPLPFSPTITGLTPNTAATQAAVNAELADLLFREAEPGGTVPLSHIREAISLATGVVDYVLTLPAAAPVVTPGQLLVPGAPIYA